MTGPLSSENQQPPFLIYKESEGKLLPVSPPDSGFPGSTPIRVQDAGATLVVKPHSVDANNIMGVQLNLENIQNATVIVKDSNNETLSALQVCNKFNNIVSYCSWKFNDTT